MHTVDPTKFNVQLDFILAYVHYKIYLREHDVEGAKVSFIRSIGISGLTHSFLVVEMHSRISIVVALCIGLTYAEPVPSMCMPSLLVKCVPRSTAVTTSSGRFGIVMDSSSIAD